MKDGGPAFPLDRVAGAINSGMTLRQWYKGMALMGLLAHTTYWTSDDLAENTARYADALLREDEEAGK